MSRIEPIATAFAEDRSAKQKRPRIKDEAHLKLIRQLPCIIDGTYPVEAAHIRAGCPRLGKRSTGKAEKPSDIWTLPLSQRRHLEQHQGAELAFWERYGIEPFSTALALYVAAPDIEAMEGIIRRARQAAMTDGLRPCPFCGEANELYRGYRDMGRTGPFDIDCLGCGITFTPREGMDVQTAWNRRTPIPLGEPA